MTSDTRRRGVKIGGVFVYDDYLNDECNKVDEVSGYVLIHRFALKKIMLY